VTPMLQASWFPLTMRLVHGLEITADAFVHGALIVWLLGFDSSKAEQRPANLAKVGYGSAN